MPFVLLSRGWGWVVLHCVVVSVLVQLNRISGAEYSRKGIFILAGQSNMSGRGGVLYNATTGVSRWDGFVPSSCQPDPDHIFRLDAELSWAEAREPLHRDIDVNNTCGIGPGMGMARSVVGRGLGLGRVGLVPCAVGGTRISQWARGTQLYKQMLRRTRRARGEQGSTIEAVVWFQGESDTVRREDAELYAGRLERLLLDFRDDLDNPLLPIIVVAIASGQGPHLETVRQAQLALDLPNVKVVDAMGLPLEPDHVHLTTQAQVHLGHQLAQAYMKYHPRPIQKIVTTSSASSSLFFHHSATPATASVFVLLLLLSIVLAS